MAVVERRGGPFVLRDVEVGPVRADEIVVELEACGMCHADLAARDGDLPFPLPAVLGHEGVGRVVEVGSAAGDIKVGMRVVISFAWCGQCPACLDASPAYCRDWPSLNLLGGARADGSTCFHSSGTPVHGHFFGQSSFARHIVTTARAVVAVPDDLSPTVLAPLGCGIQTGMGAAISVLRPDPGAIVGVFGAGAVGLSAVMGLALTAAARIIVVDVNSSRLSLASELGATDLIDASKEDPAEAIRHLTGGSGLTGAIEASGRTQVLHFAIASLAAAGICVVAGAPAVGEAVAIDVVSLVARGIRIRGTNQGDANPRTFIPRLIDLHRRGRLPVEKLVTSFAFADINGAARASHDGDVIKPVLHMG